MRGITKCHKRTPVGYPGRCHQHCFQLSRNLPQGLLHEASVICLCYWTRSKVNRRCRTIRCWRNIGVNPSRPRVFETVKIREAPVVAGYHLPSTTGLIRVRLWDEKQLWLPLDHPRIESIAAALINLKGSPLGRHQEPCIADVRVFSKVEHITSELAYPGVDGPGFAPGFKHLAEHSSSISGGSKPLNVFRPRPSVAPSHHDLSSILRDRFHTPRVRSACAPTSSGRGNARSSQSQGVLSGVLPRNNRGCSG